MSDEQLLKMYLCIDKIPCVISSPLRDNDRNPSFSFRKVGDTVYWKDFGTGESGNLIKLLARLWHVDYCEALLKIKLDTEGKLPRHNLVRKYNGIYRVTGNSDMLVKTRNWRDWDMEYWNSYGITADFLKWCNVWPVSDVIFIRKSQNGFQKDRVTIPAEKYAYAYFEFKDGNKSIKLYQPMSDRMKWLSKHDSSVWDLWKQAFYWADHKDDSTLVITSSRKDAMCIWQNLGVPAMALQGEGYIPKPKVMRQVLDRFKTVYLWYDNDFSHTNDNPGQDNARKLISLYPELHNIVIPSSYKCKDPSDLRKNCGPETLKEIWNKRNESDEF